MEAGRYRETRALFARAQGALGFGPVERPDVLVATLRQAIDATVGGAVCVIDVRVAAGYHGAMASGMLRTGPPTKR